MSVLVLALVLWRSVAFLAIALDATDPARLVIEALARCALPSIPW